MTRLPRSLVAHDAAIASFWMGLRLVSLALWLIAITRVLSPEAFGWLASLLAVCTVVSLLVPAGIPYLFFAEEHRERKELRDTYWPQAVGMVICAGPLVAIVSTLLLVMWIETPVPLTMVLAFAVLEVVSAALVQSCALWLHARGSLLGASAIPAALSLSRMVAASLLLAMNDAHLEDYLLLHAVLGLSVAVLVLSGMYSRGCSVLDWRWPGRSTLARALPFTLMGAGSIVGGELDKPLIARLLGLGPAGHYSAAYRVAAALATPATALSAAMLPRWSGLASRLDQRGLRRSFLLAAVAALVLGGGAAILIRWVTQGDAIGLLGDFAESLLWLELLTWLAAGIGLHQLAGTALIAVDRPMVRAAIDASSFTAFVLALPYAMDQLGVSGVAIAVIAVEWSAAILMAVAVLSLPLKLRPV